MTAPHTPALYEGLLRHRRREGAPHAFSMAVWFAWLDVDRIAETLDPLPLWSARRPAPVRFRRGDHLDGSDRPLGAVVRDLVADRTGRRPDGPVNLLTQLRTAGWAFNPLSVYVCWTAGGERVTDLVLEVTNTPWGERCWYVLPVDDSRPRHPHSFGPWDFRKTMHVSPFLDMDLTYRLTARSPGERFDLRLEDRRGDRPVFEADLALRRRALTPANALRLPLRHPLLTWRVSAAIYANALRLWRKGVPVHRHPGPGASEIWADRMSLADRESPQILGVGDLGGSDVDGQPGIRPDLGFERSGSGAQRREGTT